MKKAAVIHPFLMALFPPLCLYAHNIDYAPFSQILAPIVAILCFALLFSFLLKIILKDYAKAGIMTTLTLLLFFSYGHIFYVFYIVFFKVKIGEFVIGRERYFFPFYILLSIFIIRYFVYVLNKSNRIRIITIFFNIFTSLAVAISSINIATFKINSLIIIKPDISKQEIYLTNSDVMRTDLSPDIYYIILDTYPSVDTLRELCNYDNSDFTDFLKEKGFIIASKSCSNYAETFLSLASSLNMEYINYLSKTGGIKSKDLLILCRMIQDFKAWRFLKSRGYRYLHFSSGLGPTQQNNSAYINYCLHKFPSEFLKALINTTILSPFFSNFYEAEIRRQQILYSFEKLKEVPDIKAPTFAFAHLLIPHVPYVFGRNGEAVLQIGVTDSDKKRYLDQIIFVNKKIKEAINIILEKSSIPPIIVIQSDTGPNLSANVEYSDEFAKERLTIFNAYYLPNGGCKLIYDTITPVNSFRLIFNYYFNAKYNLLEDKSYFSTYRCPYKFIAVPADKLDYNVSNK